MSHGETRRLAKSTHHATPPPNGMFAATNVDNRTKCGEKHVSQERKASLSAICSVLVQLHASNQIMDRDPGYGTVDQPR